MSEQINNDRFKYQQICICCLNCPHLFELDKNSYGDSWCDYFDTYISIDTPGRKSYDHNE